MTGCRGTRGSRGRAPFWISVGSARISVGPALALVVALGVGPLVGACGPLGAGDEPTASELREPGGVAADEAGTGSGWAGPDPALGPPSAVFLVRHAERPAELADDPGLTPDGQARALDLALLLEDAGITRIHSTDTRRTRETAAPLARSLGLELEIYDGAEGEAFARELVRAPGRHLVVGHSNTVPELSVALGGEGFGEIQEAWEYDRLYLLIPGPEGMETVLLRYGVRARP
jgi:phosphohistidine phosphatase SixA